MIGDVRIRIWTQGPGCRWTCVVADDDQVDLFVGDCAEPWSIEEPSRRAVEEFAERLGRDLRATSPRPAGGIPDSWEGTISFEWDPS